MAVHLIDKHQHNIISPVQYKHAAIVPVFKDGDKTKDVDYHPISLTLGIM